MKCLDAKIGELTAKEKIWRKPASTTGQDYKLMIQPAHSKLAIRLAIPNGVDLLYDLLLRAQP